MNGPGTENLVCLICNYEGPILAGHLKKHKITPSEYKERFGVDRVVTAEYARMMQHASSIKPSSNEARAVGLKRSYTPGLRKERSDAAKKQFEDPEQRRVRSVTQKGKVVSKETKEKLRMSRLSPFGKGWYEVKKLVHERSQGKCELCGISEEELISSGKRRLFLHEKNYNKAIPDPEDCILCCSSCHPGQHEFLKGNLHQKIAHAVIGLIKAAGLDPLDENLIETPRRFASVLMELSGIGNNTDLEMEEFCNSIFPHEGNGLIAARSMLAYSLCPHHLLPVTYRVHLTYLPQGYAVGLSKLSRMVDLLARKLQLQETYTATLADAVVQYLKTPDVGVIVVGKHDCMRIRGVKDESVEIIVSEMRGDFREDSVLRAEFLQLIGKP